MQRKAAFIGALVLTMIGFGGTAFAEDAPDGSASARVAGVDGVAEVSSTEAKAGESGGSADATVLSVGDEQVVGSTQEGDGTSEDAVFDTGETELGRLTIAPSSASVSSDGSSTESHARTSLADVTVIDENTVALTVGESISDATWTSMLSTGHAETTVLRLGLFGQLEVVLLHSETDSASGGSQSYLARINDTVLISSDDAAGSCVIEIPSLLTLECLTASGGAGTANEVTGSAAGATADLGEGSLTGDVTSANQASGSGEAGAPEVSDTETGRGAPEAPGGSSLPRTGLELLGLVGIGGGLVAAGSMMRRFTRHA